MNFKKDLLLIDTELTGLDPKRHEIIQLAGVLLDKKTLKEKKSFATYIKPARWDDRDPRSMKVNQITPEQLRGAPSLKQALANFSRAFPLGRAVLSYYVGVTDISFLQEAYRKAKKTWPFDYHYFNVWGLFYAFLAKRGKLKSRKDFAGFNIADAAKMLGIEINEEGLHDALADCRLEAEVLRKVMKSL